MHEKCTRRGFNNEDLTSFSETRITTLNKASEEICFMLDRGYDSKSLVTFIGNHYQLTARQRLALQRSCCSTIEFKTRISKLIDNNFLCLNKYDRLINIDGFNTIITLEVALSNGTLLQCRDTSIKDLAGLRGTYKLIDKTSKAIQLIASALKDLNFNEAEFYLDEPISNSINLKLAIIDIFNKVNMPVKVHVVPNPDNILKNMDYVATSDSIILDNCISWVNLTSYIIDKYISNISLISFNLSDPPNP